ncbi:MAG TPA: alpha/beta fold hydrolase [Candidatus Binatia bacterium]|nr:alpha/beta fold hydrolase [Candidatus Binatia bacterium]
MAARILAIPVALLVLAFNSAAQTRSNNEPASSLWHVDAVPVVSEQVHFKNAGAELAGTAYLPEKGDHLPAVVVLHSASAGTREAGLYRHLRESLPQMGFAVLIYDRRGEGQSTGNAENISYETLADDGIAGQQALARNPRIDAARMGFWGLSQGGWLAVLAAGRSPNAAFAVSISAPLVTAEEQMKFATRNILLLRGYSDSDVREMLATRAAWTGYLRGTNSRTEALEALTKAQAKPWFGLTYMPNAAELTTDPEHNSYRHEMDDDPFAAAAKVKAPMLFMYGDSDPWIPVAETLKKLQELSGRQHNFEYAVIPNANHEMMSPIGENMKIDAETIRNDAPQAPSYFMVLGAWLAKQVTGK